MLLINADPDDNKFFDIAVAANADYLVTNDAHFNMVKNFIPNKSCAIMYASLFVNNHQFTGKPIEPFSIFLAALSKSGSSFTADCATLVI